MSYEHCEKHKRAARGATASSRGLTRAKVLALNVEGKGA